MSAKHVINVIKYTKNHPAILIYTARALILYVECIFEIYLKQFFSFNLHVSEYPCIHSESEEVLSIQPGHY